MHFVFYQLHIFKSFLLNPYLKMIMGNIFNVPMEQTANQMSTNPIYDKQLLEREILRNILRSQQWLQCRAYSVKNYINGKTEISTLCTRVH